MKNTMQRYGLLGNLWEICKFCKKKLMLYNMFYEYALFC